MGSDCWTWAILVSWMQPCSALHTPLQAISLVGRPHCRTKILFLNLYPHMNETDHGLQIGNLRFHSSNWTQFKPVDSVLHLTDIGQCVTTLGLFAVAWSNTMTSRAPRDCSPRASARFRTHPCASTRRRIFDDDETTSFARTIFAISHDKLWRIQQAMRILEICASVRTRLISKIF